MGILVALIGVAIIAAVVVASFTAVLWRCHRRRTGRTEEEIGKKWLQKNSIGFFAPLFIILQMFLLTYP